MAARSILEGATGVRRTRAGHILIEFDRTAAVNEAAVKLRAALSDSTEVAALVNRTTLQIRNIDPPTSKEVLVADIKSQWGIESVAIDMKSMKMAPWGTQVEVVILPANKSIPSEEREGRLNTGLTIASVRQLTNVQRCYRCHMLGHIAAKCTVVYPGKGLCDVAEHIMKDCDKEPNYAMCSRHENINVRHITGSLACVKVLGTLDEDSIRVLQINLNKRRLAQDQMMQRVCKSRVDIVVISEPYRQFCLIGSMTRGGMHPYGSPYLMANMR
jgi:hypothetical protein